jgi:hypothetical protein
MEILTRSEINQCQLPHGRRRGLLLGRRPTASSAWRLQDAAQQLPVEGVASHDSVHGRKRVPVSTTVEANIFDDGTLSLQDLVAMVDATVTVELNNGKTCVYQQACNSDLA